MVLGLGSGVDKDCVLCVFRKFEAARPRLLATWQNSLSTRIKDAGIAIRHSQGYTFSILQGPETDLREWTRCVDTQKTENPIKKTLFSYRKIIWGRQAGWKTRPGSARIGNEAHSSCKRRVTANLVQNESIWIQNPKTPSFNFLDPGNPKFSRQRPMPASSPVDFKQ